LTLLTALQKIRTLADNSGLLFRVFADFVSGLVSVAGVNFFVPREPIFSETTPLRIDAERIGVGSQRKIRGILEETTHEPHESSRDLVICNSRVNCLRAWTGGLPPGRSRRNDQRPDRHDENDYPKRKAHRQRYLHRRFGTVHTVRRAWPDVESERIRNNGAS
jgi:hypothetical protein